MASKTLGDILNNHSEHLTLLPSNKIKCIVTNHEMPARFDVVNAHINGKKFKKALEWYTYDYSEFLPDIIEDRNNSKQLFCTVTGQSLNKIPDKVRNHVKGKKFKRLKAEKESAAQIKDKDRDAAILDLPFFVDETAGKQQLVEEDTMSDLLDEDDEKESDDELVISKPPLKGSKRGREQHIKQKIKTKAARSTKDNSTKMTNK